MGHRSNYIIIENTEQTIHYSKWDGQDLGYNLGFGPNNLVEYIRTNFEIEEQLYAWSEGSMILDLDKKEVLFYDGLIGIESVFWKEALVELYTQTSWREWKIGWAMNGQVDIAAYLGISKEAVYEKIESIPNRPKISSDMPLHLYRNLLVLINEENVRIKLTYWSLETFLNAGFEEGMKVQKELECIDYQSLDRSQVYEFIVINEKIHSLDVYYSYPLFVAEKLFVLDNWKNWNVQFRRDGYKWLDNRLGLNFELRPSEVLGIQECFQHVFMKEHFSNYEFKKKYIDQPTVNEYKHWIQKSKYYS